MGCGEEVEVGGHGGVFVEELGDDHEDSNEIMSPNK